MRRGGKGDTYEQAVVKSAAGMFFGILKHLFDVIEVSSVSILVRAGLSQANEVSVSLSPLQTGSG